MHSYTLTRRKQKEKLREKNPIHHCDKKHNILRNTFTFKKQKTYIKKKNYKTVMKDIKDEKNRWRNIQCHRLEESVR